MPRSKEDQILYKRFRDLGNMAYQRGICVYSDFVTITQQELACQALAELYPDTHVEQLPLYAYGGYEEADRRVLMFMPPEYMDRISDTQFPISCIRIAPVNRKFGEALTHRDYLGTVMGMGLERDQIGDISGSVTTPRLDAVLSVAIRTSRTQGLQLIRDGNIYINGKCCTENAKLLREGDIISVRGYGKYRFRQTGVRSKKGRYHIMVQQYI